MCKANSAPKLQITKSRGYFREDAEERAVGLTATEEDDLETAAFSLAVVVMLGWKDDAEVMAGVL